MSDPVKSRGRARGKGRNVDPGAGGDQRPGQQAPSRGGPRGGPQQGGPSAPQGAWSARPHSGPRPQPQQGPPAQGAWGPRPGGPTPQQVHQQRAPAPSVQPTPVQPGRASMREGQGDARALTADLQGLSIGAGAGAAVEAGGAGRGSVRGRRQIGYETLLTKPTTCHKKQGTVGTPIRLTANYFELITRKDWCLYQYRVDFAPEEDRTNERKKMFNQVFKEKKFGYIFDGTVMFTTYRLEHDPFEVFVDGDTGEKIRITVRMVGDVAGSDMNMIQFFNIIVRTCFKHMKLQQVGRDYYDAAAKILIRELDIELWPGYITSIRQHENKMLLCCEITHKFMRKNTVLNVLASCVNQDSHNYKTLFSKTMIGQVVLTDYNNQTYRVDDINWELSPQSTFDRKDGTSISYIEYYAQRYKIRIHQVDQPLIVYRAKAREIRAGNSEIIYLIPELCRMTGLTDAERSNFTIMRQLHEYTRIDPKTRQERLIGYSNRMNSTPTIKAELENWGMKLADRLVEFPARILPSENIIQGPTCQIKYQSGADTDWTKMLRSNPMITNGPITIWVVVCPSQMKRDAFTFVQTLSKAASGMKFMLPNPKLHEIQDDRPATYLRALEEVIETHKPSLILCVCGNNKADRYAAIKKKCCVDRPVPTQVILKKNMISKGVMSIATKVAIQINCKLGGAPWSLEMPISNLMVVGYDVCHDTMTKSKSFGAMVASLDRQCVRYFSTVSQHSNGEELSNDFALNIIKAVKKYQECNNGNVPEKIIIYRDGVGEGQLPYVYSHEVTRIKEALAEFYGTKPMLMTFIVVTKRINTRLFAGPRNPPPGTVVDDVVTNPQRYDFFLVSQCVRQGTVSPTNYNVLYDTIEIPVDRLQRLTYKFCHMYYNWSGTVRVPAPCQYAHKLAFLVSQSLHRNPHPALDNLLYFL